VVSNDASLRAWQFGKTGYPLVDAAMRELWVTGYMPNYTRHVVAGFLIEYLNVDWRHGQLWFHDTLVDADVAIQVQTVSLRIQIPNHHPITTQPLTNHPSRPSTSGVHVAERRTQRDGPMELCHAPGVRRKVRGEFIYCFVWAIVLTSCFVYRIRRANMSDDGAQS
jgi:hypothetical protein